MKAKQVFEFGKGNSPMSTLGLGIIAEIDKRAELYKCINWKTDDSELMSLFITCLRYSSSHTIFKQICDYFLETPQYFDRLSSVDIDLTHFYTSEHWYYIASYMLAHNKKDVTDFDNKYENSDIDWALSNAIYNNQKLNDISRENRDLIIAYLLIFFQNNVEML